MAVHTYLHGQQALRASEDRFRAAFEGAVPGIAIVNADRQFERVNPAFERILGHDAKTLRGTTIDTLAGGIAHDFNNILRSATIYLEMAIEESGARVQGDARDETGPAPGKELVEKLLTLSRRSDEAVEERFALTAVTEAAIGLVRPSIPNEVVWVRHDGSCVTRNA